MSSVFIYDPTIDGDRIPTDSVNNFRSKDFCTFVLKAAVLRGTEFDYGRVIYSNGNEKVEIIHRTANPHIIRQTPHGHLKARGKRQCAACYGNAKIDTKTFISRATLLHGDTYDYSLVEEVANSTQYVDIICKIHNTPFSQKVGKHLKGQGCPRCIGRHKTTEDFIAKANEVHDFKYNYSKSNYTGAEVKTTIICPHHGEFQQSPYCHIRMGTGCPSCGYDRAKHSNLRCKSEVDKDATLYIISFKNKESNKPFYKIGITKHKDPNKRFASSNFEKEVLAIYRAKRWACEVIEEYVLQILNPYRYKVRDLSYCGDHGWTECFTKKDFDKFDIFAIIDIAHELMVDRIQ